MKANIGDIVFLACPEDELAHPSGPLHVIGIERYLCPAIITVITPDMQRIDLFEDEIVHSYSLWQGEKELDEKRSSCGASGKTL